MNLDPHRYARPSLGRAAYVVVGLLVIALLVAGFVLLDARHWIWGAAAIAAAVVVIAALVRRR